MDINEIMARLAEPFDPANVHCKPLTIAGNRALAAWYCDARDVQDRLDEVFGVGGWQDSYDVLPDGNVVCKLRIRIGDEWITKCDVGGPSEQPDEGDRVKAAFSDALKRACVKLGIGRYLYRIARQWFDYDPQKKKFATPPQLPANARPRYLSAEQAEEVRALLADTDTNEKSFLEALMFDQIGNTPESIERIPARLFENARTKLRTKKARQAKIKAEMATGVRKAAEPTAAN